MALSNLAGWNKEMENKVAAACGIACGAGEPSKPTFHSNLLCAPQPVHENIFGQRGIFYLVAFRPGAEESIGISGKSLWKKWG